MARWAKPNAYGLSNLRAQSTPVAGVGAFVEAPPHLFPAFTTTIHGRIIEERFIPTEPRRFKAMSVPNCFSKSPANSPAPSTTPNLYLGTVSSFVTS